jgi:eukaryotic-like serine/threonine-protein kinase
VADFGIARLVSEDTITSTGELFGTAAYLSPEQALGREATGASDRYALAVAAFELLAGERPFDAPHFAAQARQHIEDDRPYASDRDRTLPSAVDDVLVRGMAKDPDERFETAGDFVDALETALSGGIAVSTRRLTGPRRRARPAGVAGVGGNPNGNGRAEAARTRSNGAWHPPAATPARRPAPVTGSWTAAGTIQRGSTGRPRTSRVVALMALLVAIGGVGALALGGLGGARHPTRHASTPPRHTAGARTHAAVTTKPKAAAPVSSTAVQSSTSTSTTTPTTPTAPTTAEQLQLAGHNEMLQGNYPAAIATLKKAVSAADPSSLTYAYGLYDLGVSLLRSGDAAGAIPIL